MLALAACNSKKTDNSTPALFPQEEILSAEASLCPVGTKLREVEVTGDLEDMGNGTKLFGFSSGSGPCAVEKDIHDNNLGMTWFNLEGVGNCVPNGSLWEITMDSTMSPEHHFELQLYKGTRILKMNGARDLPATYVRDHAGVRPFKCVQE